jgi:hypothetical protein
VGEKSTNLFSAVKPTWLGRQHEFYRILLAMQPFEGFAMAATVTPQPHQLDLGLFGSADRLPRRPYCSDDLEAGLRIRSLHQALSKPYIQVNPSYLGLVEHR